MHIVLVGPELEENLTLRYLEGALLRDGHSVTLVVFDSARDVERAAKEIAGSGADIAGFTMVFTRRADEYAALIRRCRALGFAGITIAGGHFAAFHAEQLLTELPALDLVAIGEGEGILCALARTPSEPGRVNGLVWRDGDTLRRNPPAESPQNLDELAWPTHRRPFDRYLGLPIVNMLSSRGCTHACAFCSIAAWHKVTGGARYRVRSPADVAAEMGCLYREGVRLFNFHDDNFLGRDRDENLARYRALRDELKRQGVRKIGFQIKARPDSIDAEVFILLRSMGLFRVFLGIEAGTELSLKNLGRGQKLADNVRALEVLNGLDLHVAFNLLVLNPESTFEDLQGNVAFLREHLDNPMNFCRTEIYEGTPLQRTLKKQGRLLGDYWGLDYAIADTRAQGAFELFIDAFYDRNFGAHPLHYFSSQIDYEHQLRMDFFGTTAELKAAAKGFVRAVNENTVGHLERVLEAIRTGRGDAAWRKRLFEDVARDDVQLHEEGAEVLSQIRDLPEPKRRIGGATIAAAAALAIAGCTPAAPMEAAPPPPYTGQPIDYNAPPDAAAPTATTVPDAAPPPPQPMEAAPPPPLKKPPPPPPTATAPPQPMEAAPPPPKGRHNG